MFMKSMIILSPCAITSKYIAEVNFKKKLSMDILYSILKNLKIKDLRYSQELGIAKFEFKGKRIRLDKNGKISVSRISNEQDAKFFIKELKYIIKKAFKET